MHDQGAMPFALEAPTLPADVPLAQVFGQPVLSLPQDLFIPPDALRIILESFEGPLDLLLYLIRKQNLNVLDIPMAPITAQYMAYIDAMQHQQLELAAEYLLMAALLIEIKSRLLLPRPAPTDEAQQEDPRAELARRLLEYEQMKQAGVTLASLPQAGRDFLWVEVMVERSLTAPLPPVSAADLRDAWLAILSRAARNQHHQVTTDALSVREQMSWVLRKLEGHDYLAFASLFEVEQGVSWLVVNFIAILELVKEGLVLVSQEVAFAPIYIRRA